jgi:E3 ubiquitin-protein ligase SIAH1
MPKHALRESVFEVLRCPVCGDYLRPPITLCQAGHNTCSRCRPNLQCCPRCSRPLLQTRNMALETIARGLRYPCRYASAGCPHNFTMDEIWSHHAQCEHRPYPCPLRAHEGCHWTGR